MRDLTKIILFHTPPRWGERGNEACVLDFSISTCLQWNSKRKPSPHCSQLSTFHSQHVALISGNKIKDKSPSSERRRTIWTPASPTPLPLPPSKHRTPQTSHCHPPSLPNHTTLKLHPCSRNSSLNLGGQNHFLKLPDPLLEPHQPRSEALRLGRPEVRLLYLHVEREGSRQSLRMQWVRSSPPSPGPLFWMETGLVCLNLRPRPSRKH